MEITDDQWKAIEPQLPKGKSGPGKRGRPRQDDRAILEGILWILRTGAPWKHLPAEFPPHQTCHRRHGEWVAAGVLDKILAALLKDLVERGKYRSKRMLHRRDLCERKKRGLGVGKTKHGKGTKIMAIADRNGLPIAAWATSAASHEVGLAEETLHHRFTEATPQRMIGDKAYDSDKLDRRLRDNWGIEMISPHRSNRTRTAPTQDGRPLRRYRRRWKIERLFAWLQAFRRLVARWEHSLLRFQSFVHLACLIILLRHF